MADILKVKENKDGKILVTLYGRVIDLTDKMKDGEASFKAFGKEYIAKLAKKIKVKADKPVAEDVEISFIETPEEG